MKKFIRPIIILIVGLFLAMSSVSLTYSTGASDPSGTTGAAFFFQVTATPEPEEDKSVVGSTDGIVIMSGVITLIVLIPILARYRAWMRGS